MTPAEFLVLADSRIKQESMNIDVMDTLNALNCQVTVGNTELKLRDFRLFATEEIIEEQPTDDSVNMFKQWVTATGGETI